ncbi:MAG TPA: hypothetical protein VI759_02335 [Dehalococcoidia bacterium]|nr:hypothetical protein [Dehalococcoidia bacterium]
MSRYKPFLIAVPLLIAAAIALLLLVPSLFGGNDSSANAPATRVAGVATPRATSTPDTRVATSVLAAPTITPFLLHGTFTPAPRVP